MDLIEARAAEQAKYSIAYQAPHYRMGDTRRNGAAAWLEKLPRGSLLDVGTGRGELLDLAARLGFSPVLGTEVVPALLGGCVQFAEAHDLPFDDNTFDVVTCLDVLEHLVPDDTVAALTELGRVCRNGGTVLLTGVNFRTQLDGVELHVNCRSQDEWAELIARHVGEILQTHGTEAMTWYECRAHA